MKRYSAAHRDVLLAIIAGWDDWRAGAPARDVKRTFRLKRARFAYLQAYQHGAEMDYFFEHAPVVPDRAGVTFAELIQEVFMMACANNGQPLAIDRAERGAITLIVHEADRAENSGRKEANLV